MNEPDGRVHGLGRRGHRARRVVTPARLASVALVLAGSATLVILAGTSTPGLALPAYVAAARTATIPTSTTPHSTPTTASTTTTTLPVAQAVTRGTTTYITPIRAVHIEDDHGGSPSRDDGSRHQGDGVPSGQQPGD